MQRFNVEDTHHFLDHYSDGTWGATKAANGRIQIIGPGNDFEIDENEVTAVKLTAYLYSWRASRIRVVASRYCHTI
jgi:hypothetical protein